MYQASPEQHRKIVSAVVRSAVRPSKELRNLDWPRFLQAYYANVDADDLRGRDPQELAAGSGICFEVQFELPDDYKLNELFPASYQLKIEGDQTLVAVDQLYVKKEARTDGKTATFAVPTQSKTGEAALSLTLTFGYCRDGIGGVCKVGTMRWKIPVVLKDGAKADKIKLTAKAK